MNHLQSDPPLPESSVDALVFGTHAPTRIGLGVLLKQQPWVRRCLLASEHAASIEIARRGRPAVAILDVSDAVPLASALIRALREAHRETQVVLTSRCERASLTANAHGAQAFLPPDASGEAIVETVRAAVLRQAAPTLAERNRAPHGLTDREREVLLLLSTGATNHEIAAEMHLSVESVKKHATALYRKLGVRNRTQAAQLAVSLLGTTG